MVIIHGAPGTEKLIIHPLCIDKVDDMCFVVRDVQLTLHRVQDGSGRAATNLTVWELGNLGFSSPAWR